MNALVILLGVLQLSLAALQYTGVNEAGMEFSGTTCIPSSASVGQFASEGHNLFRIPFAWEKLQSNFYGSLDYNYLNQLKQAVNTVTSKGGIALIDCHNYFRYRGNLVTDGNAYADLWKKVASNFNNTNVWYGLMNEPHDMSTEQVLSLHQTAVNAIRGLGLANKIVVSGNGYDSLQDWVANPWYGTANTLLNQLRDSANNYLFEMHLYFDYDYSGTHAECSSINLNKIQATTDWLRSVGKKALVTEFGLGNNANCVYNYGKPFLQFLRDNSDVWAGYTYWSAGSCWPNDYIYTIDPHNNVSPSDSRVQLLQTYAANT
eukprot:gene24427-29526_t